MESGRSTRRRAYAGVGSRQTPRSILDVMQTTARSLRLSHLLRSGGARGADQAFYSGAQPHAIVFSACDCTPAAHDLASRHHPAWDRCSDIARALHGRNMMVLLGAGLDDPVEFVLCWTPGGETVGGTGHLIRAARSYGIPVYNLFHSTALDHLRRELALDGTLR